MVLLAIGLLYSISDWFQNTKAGLGFIVGGVVILIMASSMFFLLRDLINWTYKKKYGIPHPSMARMFDL